MNCPLCSSRASPFVKNGYFDCPVCRGIFMDPAAMPDADSEKTRYELHNNDVNDPGYRGFVSPVTDYVLANRTASEQGLDFGCGPGPVIAFVLDENGYEVARYDPFFANRPELLERHYDYIICCEVIEHFHRPAKEFSRLVGLLKPCGELVCMTWLYDDSIDFSTWHYARDLTHTFFYRRETIDYIASEFRLDLSYIKDRLIVMTAPLPPDAGVSREPF